MENFAAEAENVIKNLIRKDENGRNKIDLTTTQIRKILTAINSLSNKLAVDKAQKQNVIELSKELMAELQYIKVRIIYQAGRDNTVKTFVNKAKLFDKIDGIGNSISKYESFARYVEALVAYHRFYGGRDY